MKRALVVLIVLVVAGLSVGWYLRRPSNQPVELRTAPVARGEVVSSISATGTVEPEELIDIGAQVAGQISAFGNDDSGKPVDYNSQVEEGMLLAKIDDTLYAADFSSAQAQLQQAQAGVKRAQADLQQMQAKLYQAQRDWERAEKLGPSDALAQTSYDAYRSAYDTAKANVGVGEASVVQSQSAVALAEAAVMRAKRNLGYCVIKSPVKGVIIDRRVNIGQTVVASLNAPSLFLIATDMRKMQVWVAVNEADIGQIHEGVPVTFTVDSLPDRTFHGVVGKVRLNASMTQNVVTYTVEVETDNPDLALKPYLTANIKFEVGRRDDVLTVQNAALRWTPTSADQVAPEVRAQLENAAPSAGGSGGERTGGRRRRGGAGGESETQPSDGAAGPSTRPARGHRPEGAPKPGTLWVRDGQFVRPIEVRTGLTDGLVTEVMGDGVKEGMEVVVGEVTPREEGASVASGGSNPFQPQMPWARRNRSGGGGGGGPGGGGNRGGGGGRGG